MQDHGSLLPEVEVLKVLEFAEDHSENAVRQILRDFEKLTAFGAALSRDHRLVGMKSLTFQQRAVWQMYGLIDHRRGVKVQGENCQGLSTSFPLTASVFRRVVHTSFSSTSEYLMPNTKTLDSVLETHAVLLDTCFAMQSGFAEFVRDHESVFTRNPILVPTLVIKELERLAGDGTDNCQATARQRLTALTQLIDTKQAQIRGENCDVFADQVIQRVVEQHMLSRDIVVLTNDAPLMRDLRAKLKKESVRSRKSLEVIKLHARTQKAIFFRPRNMEAGFSAAGNRNGHGSPDSMGVNPVRQHAPRAFRIESNVAMISEKRLPAGDKQDTGSSLKCSDGTLVVLGKQLAAGGEGAVFEIVGRSEVCKLYFPDKLTEARRDKIELMVSHGFVRRGICWPLASVADAAGVFRGFLMPRASGQPLGHTLFLPHQLQRIRPDWTRKDSVSLALHILYCIEALHRINVLIGDINPQNILFAAPDEVYIVDCDSFQVEGFPCPVGTVNFTAPEIQGQDYGTFLRTNEHELFAVATLLFMILFPGKCPYSHAGGEDGATNIRKMEFSYTSDWSTNPNSAPKGVWMYCWGHLSGPLKRAFAHSFQRDHFGEPRITVQEWIRLLKRYQRDLNDSSQVFVGPRPKVGYDLQIMPRSKRFKPGEEHLIPADGSTGFDRLLSYMERGHRNNERSSGPSSLSSRSSTAAVKPHVSSIGTAVKPEVFNQQATQDAIHAISSRTFRICVTVCIVAVIATVIANTWYPSKLIIGLGSLISLGALAAAFNRTLNESQYYSLPGSRYSNGDHRCIHCGHRSSQGRGIKVYKSDQNDSTTKHDCGKCSKNLFTS